MPLPQLSIYRNKNGNPLVSNINEPNATRVNGSIPMLRGGGTPQSRYSDQQAQLASRSQYDQEVADATASRQLQQQILNAPQVGMSEDMQQRINNAIEQNIKAGQQDMRIGANAIQAKYANQQLGDLLSANTANAGLMQRGVEAQQNAQNQQMELQQKQSVLNSPGQGLSRHFESTANGIMAIDPLTGIAKPVMGADGKPLTRAQNDLDLQQKIMDMRMGGKTAQAVEQGTALLPIKQQEANIKNQSELSKTESIKARDALGTLDLLKEAEKYINDSTGSGIGASVDSAQAFFGGTNKGAIAASQLGMIGGHLTSKMPRMEGPQSDKDAALYKQMAGSLGDPTVPVATKKANMQTMRSLNQKYAAYNPELQQQPNTTQQAIPPAPAGVNPARWAAYQAHINGGQ
jgi:hypothetical protein